VTRTGHIQPAVIIAILVSGRLRLTEHVAKTGRQEMCTEFPYSNDLKTVLMTARERDGRNITL
jgi:hypothetical protein